MRTASFINVTLADIFLMLTDQISQQNILIRQTIRTIKNSAAALLRELGKKLTNPSCINTEIKNIKLKKGIK